MMLLPSSQFTKVLGKSQFSRHNLLIRVRPQKMSPEFLNNVKEVQRDVSSVLSYDDVPPLPEGKCGEEALKPDGLTAIFNEFSETFPTFEFLGTFLEALSDDEEVVQVMALLLTDDFNILINKIGDIDEWVEITDIFCDDLQFNVNFYLKVIGDLLKVVPIDPSTPKSENRTRPGVMGLLRDIVDILPLDEWRPKFNDLIEQNEAFRIAIDTVKGDLLKAVVMQTCHMDEFRNIINNVGSFGIPVACGMTRLEQILGWPYVTCACGEIRVGNKC